MGFENRDYFQDEDSWQPRWGHDTPTTRLLIIVTVIVFLAQTIVTREGSFDTALKFGARRVSLIDEWFMLDAPAVLAGQVWRVLTYVFCHDRQAPFSLVLNMVAVWFLGSRLERMYGKRELLAFYLCSSISAGVLYAACGTIISLPVPLSGATPAVLSLFTLYATHFPREKILFAWIIPIEIWVLLWIYTGLDVYSILLAVQGDNGPAAAVHAASDLCGIGFGYIYHRFCWQLNTVLEYLHPQRLKKALQRGSTRRNLRVFKPVVELEDIDTKVDLILAKIHEFGSENITDAERATLTRASERIKKRTQA